MNNETMKMQRWMIPALLLGLAIAPESRADQVNTFEEFNPGANAAKPFFTASSTTNGSTPLVSQGNVFNNEYTYFNPDPVFGYIWSGWAVSSRTDRTTEGVEGQFSSVTGGGYNGSSTYVVATPFGSPAYGNIGVDPATPGYSLTNPFHPSDSTIDLAAGQMPVSLRVTNTAYAYYSFLRGDPYGFSAGFQAGDFQTLDIRGYDASGNLISFLDAAGDRQSAITVSLADFRTAAQTILDTWQFVDLTPLAAATQLRFGITSSRNDATYGVNTPAYFAADDFVTRAVGVPEPASLVLLVGGLGIAGMVSFRGRRHRPGSLEGDRS